MAHHLDKRLFDLKLAAKQITRNAKKLKKEEAKEMDKCWKCVMRGEHDTGRVHAENAVRNHNQSLELLTLGARLEGAVNVLQMAVIQNGVTSAMRSVVMSMASATRHMNIPSLTTTVRRFELMTDHLSARQAYATGALDHSSGRDVSADQVDALMARVVDRAGLDVRNEMPVAECSPQGSTADPAAASSMLQCAAGLAPGLEERLAKLRNEHCVNLS